MLLKEAKEILKKNGYLVEARMSLKDKIANAKKFNSWENKDEKTKIKLLRELLDSGCDAQDDNPWSDQDIWGDFYDIEKLAKKFDIVTDKLEKIWNEKEFEDDFGDWVLYNLEYMMCQILDGVAIKDIVEYFTTKIDIYRKLK